MVKKIYCRRMPGDEWQKIANLRLLYGYMFMHPGTKLLFMGCEFGQSAEWNFEGSLDLNDMRRGKKADYRFK
jgi:1,4-alpha-glucan branching enzyme